MTDAEILKKLTGETDTELIEVLLDDARETVLAYTGRSHMIPELERPVRDLALIAYNRMGTEGEASRNAAGESYNFNDTPASVYGVLNRYRLARIGGDRVEAKDESC